MPFARDAGIVMFAALSLSASVALAASAEAQGMSTGTIRGSIRTNTGARVEDSHVLIRNTATGFELVAPVKHGRFVAYGLDPGESYVIEARAVGFLPLRRGPLSVGLEGLQDIQMVLQPLATSLDPVVVSAPAEHPAHAGGGTATVISDSLIHRLPTLNRNFIDFVNLVPQVSTRIGFQRDGITAAGANSRFNSYLINGADERLVNGSVSAANIAKSIPIDAVKEYQVLVAPYDVRYGDFAGAIVNTVTRSGTNELKGSAFAQWRNNHLARDGSTGETYERWQAGFALGGPLIRNRVHFFVAPEIQSTRSPAPGPYFGQPPEATPGVQVASSDVARFAEIMGRNGLAAGSGNFVELKSPLRNLFARVDASIPRLRSRGVAFVNYSRFQNEQFSRVARDTFYLSNYRFSPTNELRVTSLQLHTELPRLGGAHNELIASHVLDRSDQIAPVAQPLVRVMVPGAAGGSVALVDGTAALAQGRFRRSQSIKIKNELNVPWGSSHLAVFGIQAERFRSRPGGVENGYGTWTFSSLDAFERSAPERFELRKDFGSASAELNGNQYAVYAGDEWKASERLSVTFGIRGDALNVSSRGEYNAEVDSIFGRRTDEMPRARVHVSPRLGFALNFRGVQTTRLRGGIGLFTGRPPLAWLHPAVSSYGLRIGSLRCGFLPGDAGFPPAFVADRRNQPTACATGQGIDTEPTGDVDILQRNLRMAQSLRASLAFDRQLPWNLISSTEILLTRYASDFVFVNLNLAGPRAVDRDGRVLYGTIGTNGVSDPALRSRFSEVIDIRNTSKNYSHQLSSKLERRFTSGVAASASYTWSRVRDVQSPSRVNLRGTAIWADGRAMSGRHEDETIGISLNDVPHRVVAAVTYVVPWSRGSSHVSLYYVGESGGPFTYRAGGTARRGDLNADGSNANDPIYVPVDAADIDEIRFSGISDAPNADNSASAQALRVSSQQTAFQEFIQQSKCLGGQRGRILVRHSCREPWTNTTIASLRQGIPGLSHALNVELSVFNFLNLVDSRWGQYRISAPQLLEHVGQTSSSPQTARPVFRFDTSRTEWTTLRDESAFQLQIAARYTF